jgi:hypothetical protein
LVLLRENHENGRADGRPLPLAKLKVNNLKRAEILKKPEKKRWERSKI